MQKQRKKPPHRSKMIEIIEYRILNYHLPWISWATAPYVTITVSSHYVKGGEI